MTALQILDRLAFCIGYAVIGGVALVLIAGAVLLWSAMFSIGLKHDSEKRQDD